MDLMKKHIVVQTALESKVRVGIMESGLLWYTTNCDDQKRPQAVQRFQDQWKHLWTTCDIVIAPCCDGVHWCFTCWCPRAGANYVCGHVETMGSVVRPSSTVPCSRLVVAVSHEECRLQVPERCWHPRRAAGCRAELLRQPGRGRHRVPRRARSRAAWAICLRSLGYLLQPAYERRVCRAVARIPWPT
jgi:hypothetical protein